MRFRGSIGFGCAASVAAALGASALSPIWLGADRTASAWATIGFFAMAVPAIVGGAWLAHEHGRSGSRFVLALGTGFIARMVLAAIAAFGASRSGGAATTGLLAGLAAGFAPVTVLEMIWFSRARVQPGVTSERRG